MVDIIQEDGFDRRNSLKRETHTRDMPDDFYVNKREVWYVRMGENIGYEQNGKGSDYKRPVLVIKKLGNVFFTVAMTTKGKDDSFFYYKMPPTYCSEPSYLIVSQFKVIDKKRFIEKMYTISEAHFKDIKKELKQRMF